MTHLLPSWLRKHRIALLRTGIVFALLYALYLLAANVFLNTPLGVNTINRKPQRFSAQWDWAMSLYPGHIYARNLHLRGRVRTIEWRANGSTAHGRIHLLPLLRKRLRFGTIHAGAVTVDVDTGKPPMPATPRTGAARARKPWELVFDSIRSDQLRHLSLGEWRMDGEGAARFAFYKQIGGGPMEIPASEFHMRKATLHQGDARWAYDATIDLDLAIARHVPAQLPGLAKLQRTEARLRLSGEAPALELREASDGTLKLQRNGHGGKLTADLGLRRGALTPGSRLHASLPLALDSAKDGKQMYAVEARVDVQADAIALRVRVPRQEPSRNHIDVDLQLPGRQLPLQQVKSLLTKAQGKVQLQWHFGSLAWLNPLLSEGWLRFDGAADVQASLQIANGRLVAGSTASIPHASVRADVQDNTITGQASAQARVSEQGTTLELDAKQFAIAPGNDRRRHYVRGNDLHLDLVSSSDLATFREQLQARLRFENALIPDLRAYNRYLPEASLALLGGSGALDGDLTLDAKGMPLRAKIGLSGRGAAMQVGVSRITGDLTLNSALRRVSGRNYALDTLRLKVSNVRLASAPGDGPWWARFELDDGRFGWQVPLRLDGEARLQMKDVSILMALFAERSAFPRWVGKIIDEGQLDATARVRVNGESVVLDRLRASNDRIDLFARMCLAGERSSGDLYARWGLLGMGVELREGRRKLHMVGAKRWYERQPDLLGK